jgi:hypothetical protein
MSNSKFFVTLVAMFALLVALFGGEISQFSEGYMHGSGYCKNSTTQDPAAFAAWGGGGTQIMNVGGTPLARGNEKICNANTTLGYQTSECGVNQFQQGVSSKRSIQPLVSPRINSIGVTTGPRFKPGPGNMMANNPRKPIDNIKTMADLVQSSPVVTKTKEGFAVDYESAQVSLPTDMCNINLMGTESQPVIYDRLMYSNMRSRLRGQGDYIRGDLQIVPDNYKAGYQHNNWFQVSVKPERDLNPGAMDHLYGKSQELSLSVGQGDVCVPTFGL